MNRVKFFEVRDRHTFIPAIAIDCSLTGDASADYLLRRAGYGWPRCILLTGLQGGRPAHYDPHDWPNRTMGIAHQFIADHWDALEDSAVIDVEFIMGETDQPKTSERVTYGTV